MTQIRQSPADVRRNDPCPCGSGKKYKRCCLKTSRPAGVLGSDDLSRADAGKQGDAHCVRGNELKEKGEYGLAVQAYRKAIEVCPQHVPARVNLADLLQNAHRNDEAIELLKQAIELAPERTEARLSLAFIYAQLGNKDTVARLCREVLAIDPDNTRAWYRLCRATPREVTEEDLARIHRLIKTSAKQDDKARIRIRHCLVRVHMARDEYAEAHRWAEEANRITRTARIESGRWGEPRILVEHIDKVIAAYDPKRCEETSDWGLPTTKPVLVVGLPRSGTTLVSRIFGAHPQVFSAGELKLLKKTYRAVPLVLGRKDASPDDTLGDLTAKGALRLAKHYIHVLHKMSPDAERIVDKTPGNYLLLGLFRSLFPNGKIIHLRRDVRDVAVSIWTNDFAEMFWACDQDWIATEILQYRRIMDHWRRVLPGEFLEIDYEDIVRDFEASARRLIDWVDLPWDDACLEPHRAPGPVRTASIGQVHQPVYSSSIGRWKSWTPHLGDLFERIAPATD